MISSFLLASAALWVQGAPVPSRPQPAPPAVPSTDSETSPAPSQPAPPDEEEFDQEITVRGQRPPGSVVGDIPPENVLDPRQIRATGATSIAELISSVASQTGSLRGRGPGGTVVLLNGQRVSGFRELADLPPEAIQRMEILPEEVALKYGYAADQKVINFVLRRRFNSTTAELGGRLATDGGYAAARANAGKLIIQDNTRTSLNLRLEGNNPLTESERDIALRPAATVDDRPFRTLVGADQAARFSGTLSRPIAEGVAGTLTGEVERRRGSTGLGLIEGARLGRETITDTLGLGGSINSQQGRWRLSTITNLELAERNSETERTGDLSRSRRSSLGIDGTANGSLFRLPAGTATATIKLGANALSLESESRVRGVAAEADLNRQLFTASTNLDLPLTERASAIGRLSANLNGGVTRVSDFGTLTNLGAGLNWSPVPRLTFLTSWTREEGAPTLQQLGDPLLETSAVPFFDAARGETVAVTTLTGGNPLLSSDRRNVFKLGGNWQPLEDPSLRLRAEFVHQSTDQPQIGFPAATAALETAFPDRFRRDAGGRLVSVDLRPVNAERSTRSSLRWGFDFSKPLRTERPSRDTIDRLIQRGRQSGNSGADGVMVLPQGSAPPSGAIIVEERSGRGPESGGSPRSSGGDVQMRFGGGGGGGGGGFGRGRGGRLTLSATHTITFTDELLIRPGLAPVDYLSGEAAGAVGGRARHQVQAEGGYYNNGLGLRLQADWRSATRIDSGGNDLRFAPYATFDLRAFVNLGERLDLVTRVPFFRGSSVRLEVNNIFNARPEVSGGGAAFPFAYQPDRLEPIGRTVGITFRKLFVPQRFLQRTLRQLQRPQ